MSRPILRIATRKSALAMWQTEHVADRLRRQFPELDVSLLPLSTRGDEVLDRSLAAIGGKGLFLKELEVAMQRGEAPMTRAPASRSGGTPRSASSVVSRASARSDGGRSRTPSSRPTCAPCCRSSRPG